MVLKTCSSYTVKNGSRSAKLEAERPVKSLTKGGLD